MNQLQHNIVWGQKGNFLDVPTDCPQRDERLGWTGDAQVFSRTAAFNMDVAGFFTKWLQDVAADQFPRRSRAARGAQRAAAVRGAATLRGRRAGPTRPRSFPGTCTSPTATSASWRSSTTACRAGSATRTTRAGEDLIWDGDFHFGDWLAFASAGMAANDYPGATTGKDLIATAFFAHSTDLLRRSGAGARQDGRRGPLRGPADQDQGRIPPGVRHRRRPRGRRNADRIRAGSSVRSPARGDAADGGQEAGRGGAHAEAPHDGLPGHPLPLPCAQPLRIPGRSLPAAQSRGLSRPGSTR